MNLCISEAELVLKPEPPVTGALEDLSSVLFSKRGWFLCSMDGRNKTLIFMPEAQPTPQICVERSYLFRHV